MKASEAWYPTQLRALAYEADCLPGAVHLVRLSLGCRQTETICRVFSLGFHKIRGPFSLSHCSLVAEANSEHSWSGNWGEQKGQFI